MGYNELMGSAFFLVINVISFTIVAWDKKRATAKGWRVPEKRLLFWGCIGGALGLYLGMRVFRHKLRKPLFSRGIPFLILLQTGLLAYCWA